MTTLANYCDSVVGTAADHSVPTVSSIADHLLCSLQAVNSLRTPSQILISSLKYLPRHPVKLQSRLNSCAKDIRFHNFLKGCSSKHDKARVISCGGSTAGSWLDAIPSTQVFTMSNTDFRVASLLQLGAPLPSLRSLNRCIPQCKQPLDNSGYHLLICK